MNRSLNTAATGMLVQQRNLDVIANNLANINTTAFKAGRAHFQDLMYQTMRAAGSDQGGGITLPAPQQVGMGSKFVAAYSSFAPGALQATGEQLHVAINGGGFFGINLPDGTIAYTRDGSLSTNAEGLLVTTDGHSITGNITLPANVQSVAISANGTVTATAAGSDPQVVGTIQVYMFANPAGLEKIGSNLYRVTVASGEATETEAGQNGAGTLEQGFLEGSNVQMVDEMVKMILAQRAYEVNSKAIQTADEMLNATNNLKR